MKQCGVCCEPFNKSTRLEVECRYCDFSPCSTCSERYLLETTEDAHCMNCRKGWTREILVDNFSQKFVARTYKARREELLLERERSLMPATQPYVEIEKEIRRINTKIVEGKTLAEEVQKVWTSISARSLAVLAVEHSLSGEFEASILRHKLGEEQRKIVNAHMIDIQHLEWTRDRYLYRLHGGHVELEKRVFVRACPATDCRGFLSTAWKCGMCDNWACPECHEVKGLEKDAPHTCDPNNVETAKLLAKDSRNCPKCASAIFKIDGCDQMYCTQCHTAFSWRTGRIETGTIHNPHYYDYQRAHGGLARNPGDVPCGGFPDWSFIQRLPQNMDRVSWARISSAHRSYGHCQWVMIPRYTVNQNDDNRDLRIKLMIGDFSEDEFKKKIQQREKARQRKTDIRQVLEMYQAVLNDVFQAFVASKNTTDLLTSIGELRNHVNTTLKSVSRRYTNCATPTITEGFELI